MNSESMRWRQLAIGVSLIVFFMAVYFLTYRGYAISRDEWFLFDATESMARRGNLEQNYEFDAYPPFSLKNVKPPSADTEPLQPILAVPLFLTAQALPGLGLAHTVWVFNVLITALTMSTFYAYSLALGYRIRVAVLAALMLGLGTIVWAYSRTFFREPLFSWLILLSAYLMMRLRQQISAGIRAWGTGIAFAFALAGALLSKEASLLLVPVIVVEALPARLGRIHITRRKIAILTALVLFGGVLALVILNIDTLLNVPNRYALVSRLRLARQNFSGMFEGIKGYMFSPGRSLWIFSPVLLVGFFGLRRLARQRRWRQIAVPLVMLATYTLGYALVRGPERWTGGVGWGARYLVPVVPFLALWLLPVVESLQSAAWWKRLGVGMVFLLSAGIQVLAALVSIHTYYTYIESKELSPHADIWSIRWSPLPVYLDLLGDYDLDLAWLYAVGDAWLLPVLCVALAAAAVGFLIWWNHRPAGSRRAFAITAAALGVSAVITLGGGLYAIRQDPRYAGNFQPLRDLLSELEPQLEPDDVVVLNDYTYSEFFMNYYKLAEPIVYTLPLSPGERFSPEQPPQIVSANPEELIHFADTIIFADLAQRHDRVWLVMNSSPFVPWSVRPVEQYLTRHYFPVSEVKSSDITRAVLFDMTPAPDATMPVWPAQRVDAVFGDSLRLAGYDMLGGNAYQPGDVVPVSLLWETLASVPQDYTVGVFLVAADGRLIAQHDAFPANYFEHTQSWRPGSLHRDNHGLQLPDTVPPGEYELWVVLYWWETPADRLPVTDAEGRPVGDHAVLTTVTVNWPAP